MICPPADRDPGQYPIESLPSGWATAEVAFRHRNNDQETRREIIDLKNSKRYLQEPLGVIAGKCLGLFLVAFPCYTIAYTFFHVVRTPIVTVANLSLNAFGKQVWALVRIPFYFIALESAALYGTFKPLEGRALFGELESQFHDGKKRQDAIQYEKKDLTWVDLTSTLTRENEPRAFFAGFCMQPIGKTDDPHLVNVQILPNPPVV